ncbi:MAG: hypothetical protein KIT27_04675 [Legionellales bacterium]|nr:hypothetical protein [Legionellales bacterium]
MDDFETQRRSRAKRLELLRKMANLSRRAVEEKYGIDAGTLQNWEDARYGGLTEKGAHRMIKILKTEGVNCAFEWLMHGMGQGPHVQDPGFIEQSTRRKAPANKEEELIREELLLFHRHTQNPIDYQIEDDAMLPMYHHGDYVAGQRYFRDEIKALIGQTCIVQTADGLVSVRHLQFDHGDMTFNLTSLNPNTKLQEPTLYHVELVSAAPILWWRRLPVKSV